MNSLEALKIDIFDMFKMIRATVDIQENEQILATIENQLLQYENYKELQKVKAYNEIVNADLSEAEKALKHISSRGLPAFFNDIPIIENSLKKAKAMEDRENKIKEIVKDYYDNALYNDNYLLKIQAILKGGIK